MSFGKPTRSCARRAPILRWRSSAAGPSHDRLHRRSPWDAWGRADLYHAHVVKRRDPAKLPARARQDAALKIEVRRVFDQNFSVYGVQGPATAQARGLRCCPLHGIATDAGHGLSATNPSGPRSATRLRHVRWNPRVAHRERMTLVPTDQSGSRRAYSGSTGPGAKRPLAE